MRAEAGEARVRLVDVDADEGLHARYSVRVPVVAIDGHDLFELHLDATAFRHELARRR